MPSYLLTEEEYQKVVPREQLFEFEKAMLDWAKRLADYMHTRQGLYFDFPTGRHRFAHEPTIQQDTNEWVKKNPPPKAEDFIK